MIKNLRDITVMAKKKSTVAGTLRDQPNPPPLRFHRVVVYSLYGEPSLTLTDTCGDLIDKLISICVAGPEFLPPETSRRYLHLLPNFKNFVFSVPHPAPRDILVAKQRGRYWG